METRYHQYLTALLITGFLAFAYIYIDNTGTSALSMGSLRNGATAAVSYPVTKLETQSEPGKIVKLKLLFLGDMMFDRGVRAQINAHGFEYVFGASTSTIAAHDITIANLEGPVTSNISATMTAGGKAIPGFQFTFPIKTAAALKNAGIDIVSLANNHTLNFGQKGLNETRNELVKANISFFGSPSNTSALMATTTCTHDFYDNNVDKKSNSKENTAKSNPEKMCIGIIGWHEFAHANNSAVIENIKNLRSKVDYLVVFPHWGVEYEYGPTEEQRAFAHAWIDAGADAVIGAHPHVVETIESYKNKMIFYSLGNFIFDQYFSFETTHGIGVSVDLIKVDTGTSTSATYSVIPFSSVGSKVSVPDATSTARLYKTMREFSSPQDLSLVGM